MSLKYYFMGTILNPNPEFIFATPIRGLDNLCTSAILMAYSGDVHDVIGIFRRDRLCGSQFGECVQDGGERHPGEHWFLSTPCRRLRFGVCLGTILHHFAFPSLVHLVVLLYCYLPYPLTPLRYLFCLCSSLC